MAPAATRAAVSRALARSSTSRMSVRSYLMAPARSACPGRGRVTRGRAAPVASAGGVLLGVHRLFPVFPIPISDQQGDRRADRFRAPHAREDLGLIRFDGHPAPAPVSALAAAQLLRDGVEIRGAHPPASLRE